MKIIVLLYMQGYSLSWFGMSDGHKLKLPRHLVCYSLTAKWWKENPFVWGIRNLFALTGFRIDFLFEPVEKMTRKSDVATHKHARLHTCMCLSCMASWNESFMWCLCSLNNYLCFISQNPWSAPIFAQLCQAVLASCPNISICHHKD